MKVILLFGNLERSVRKVNFVAVNPVIAANESVEAEELVTLLQVFAVIRRVVESLLSVNRVALSLVESLLSVSRVSLSLVAESPQLGRVVQGSPHALPE